MKRSCVWMTGFVILAMLAVARGDMTESWDTGHQNWHYVAQGHAEPLMTHVTSGGVGDSGYVQADFYSGNQFEWLILGGDLNWVYWPNFVYPEADGLTPNVDFTGADVSIYIKASTGYDMQGGQFYFYIGKVDELDRWSLYRHNTPLAIGDNTWVQSSITLASTVGTGFNEWTLMQGGDFAIAEALAHPTEFGFTITDVPDEDIPNPTGVFGFDEFHTTGSIIPEPASAVLLLALSGVSRNRRRRD